MSRTLSRVLVALLLVLFAGASASAEGWFGFDSSRKGSGNVVTESRDLKPFDRIESSGCFDIEVTVGGEQKITVSFDDNLIELIETEVKANTLHIRARKSFSSRRGCRIEITVPELVEVFASGSGDISVTNLETERFEFGLSGSGDFFVQGKTHEMEISLSGSGDVTAEGQTQGLEINLSGSGNISARDLKAEEVYVKISGSGDVKVFAEESFDGTISGSGRIAYYGDPEHTSSRVSGSGRIRKR